MVVEKLIKLKRFLLLLGTHSLVNIEKNSKIFFYIILYLQLLITTILFGFWSFHSFYWHTLVLALYLFFLCLLLRISIRRFIYIKKSSTIKWIEKKNFKSINPISAIDDKPINISLNKAFWYLHKKNTYENLKNLRFFAPKLSLDKVDPLRIRWLAFVFLTLSIFWSIQNHKFYSNISGILKFEEYNKEKEFFRVQAWIKPPYATKMRQKKLDLSPYVNKRNTEEIVPINSELIILVNSNIKNLLISDLTGENLLNKKDKNYYEVKYVLNKEQNIYIKKNNEYFYKWNFVIKPDNHPKIEYLSNPSEANGVALTFVSKASDDYGIKSVNVYLEKPKEYNHFIEKHIKYVLIANDNANTTSKAVDNYFYKYLSNLVWSDSLTKIIIEAYDTSDQVTKIFRNIKIPRKKFKEDTAYKIIKLREEIAKKNISLNEGKRDFLELFNKNKNLKNDKNIEENIILTLKLFESQNDFAFSIKNELFKKLYDLAEMIEDGKFYLAKKNVEQIEQNLFDSVKQKETDKISTNIDQFKDSIKSLLKLNEDNERNKKAINQKADNSINDEIEKITQKLQDLLNTGSREEADKQLRKLQQLTESIKNPNKRKDNLNRNEKREKFINKLSELLNEQEKVMEETFNRAANRGKFEQSSEGSGGRSSKEKQEELRNTLGNLMRDIGASENEIPQELAKADRAMRQATKDLENGRPDDASNAQGRAVEMIQRSINKINDQMLPQIGSFAKAGEEDNAGTDEKDFLAENENIEYQGTSAGGKINIPTERTTQMAKKIVDELYDRYNDENRSFDDKKHIKNLLNWY